MSLRHGKCNCDAPRVVRHTAYDQKDGAKLFGSIDCENCGARMMFDCQFRPDSWLRWEHEVITAEDA